MSPSHIHILRHSLGLDDKGHGAEYRNHFVTCPGCTDYPDCVALVESGMMRDHGKSALYGGGEMRCFTVTEVGKKAVSALKEPLPKLSRSKIRYREYLKVADCFESFRDFLKCSNSSAR